MERPGPPTEATMEAHDQGVNPAGFHAPNNETRLTGRVSNILVPLLTGFGRKGFPSFIDQGCVPGLIKAPIMLTSTAIDTKGYICPAPQYITPSGRNMTKMNVMRK